MAETLLIAETIVIASLLMLGVIAARASGPQVRPALAVVRRRRATSRPPLGDEQSPF